MRLLDFFCFCVYASLLVRLLVAVGLFACLRACVFTCLLVDLFLCCVFSVCLTVCLFVCWSLYLLVRLLV